MLVGRHFVNKPGPSGSGLYNVPGFSLRASKLAFTETFPSLFQNVIVSTPLPDLKVIHGSLRLLGPLCLARAGPSDFNPPLYLSLE